MAPRWKLIVPFVVLAALGGGCGSSSNSSDSCDPTGPAAGCLIAGLCFPAGTASPGNPCLVCDPARDSAGWSDDDGQTCDDGLACTTGDACSAGQCQGQPACLASEVCDAVSGECVAQCTGCVIAGVCYGAGQANPQNACVKCDPAASSAAWSDDDGAPCDDGVFCNGADTCSGGTCATHAGDPCGDDGVYCNGTESCNESAQRCDHSGDPCTGDDLCLEATNQCCLPNVPATTPVCDANGDVVATDSCGNDFVYQDCDDAHGTCVDGRCGCQPHFRGPQCDQCIDGWLGAECDQRCAIRVDGANGDDSAHDGSTWALALKSITAGQAEAVRTGCEVWVAAGTYKPGTAATDTFQLRAGVSLYGGFAGTEATRGERDIFAHPTILSGDLGGGVKATHVVTGAEGALLDGFTIRDGNAAGSMGTPAGMGGGMLNNSVSPTIANCTFTANSATMGGAIANTAAAAPWVHNCTFTGNTAGMGGAMFNMDAAAPQVVDSTFTGNTVTGASGMGAGGAIANWTGAAPSIAGCTFSGNLVAGSSGGFGGAIGNIDAAFVTVAGSTFTGNGASLGGAIATMVQSATQSVVMVEGCTFRSNAALTGGMGMAIGGALAAVGGSSTVNNSVFVANSAAQAGGALALYVVSGTPTLTVTNCTIAGNQAASGAGGVVVAGGAFTMTNSIAWGNTAPSMPDIGVSSGAATITYSDVQGGYAGTGNIAADPNFVAAPGDVRLGSTSPCIDVGSNAAAGTTDADGKARVVDGNADATATVDMGAYEYRCAAEGVTCAAIKAATPAAPSGIYYINPSGGCGSPAFCDMTTDGGGWTIVNAITGADNEQPLVSDVAAYGNPLAFGHYNLRRAQKMALAALSTQSIFVRQTGAWLKLDKPLFDQSLSTASTHVDVAVGLTSRSGATASGYMGYSNFNIAGGGDFYVGTASADHHSTNYYHLNNGCAGQYLYSYSLSAQDGDAGYDVNTALGDWTVTAPVCNPSSPDGGSLVFFSAMR
jgi:hypothetical protein